MALQRWRRFLLITSCDQQAAGEVSDSEAAPVRDATDDRPRLRALVMGEPVDQFAGFRVESQMEADGGRDQGAA